MTRERDNLIAGLTEDLAPVRAFRARDGLLLVAGAALLTLAGVELVEGLWRNMFADAAPFFWVTNGLLLVAGLAAVSAVVTMASPRVGNHFEAPKWAAIMLMVLPLTAVLGLASSGNGMAIAAGSYSLHCFASAMAASILTGGVLTMWLRRGAPVSLNAAGWLTGLAAGSIGSALYGLSCAWDTVPHLGIWHVLPVVITAIIGRLAVPRLVGW